MTPQIQQHLPKSTITSTENSSARRLTWARDISAARKWLGAGPRDRWPALRWLPAVRAWHLPVEQRPAAGTYRLQRRDRSGLVPGVSPGRRSSRQTAPADARGQGGGRTDARDDRPAGRQPGRDLFAEVSWSLIGPAIRRPIPAARAASMATCKPFSGVMRAAHTASGEAVWVAVHRDRLMPLYDAHRHRVEPLTPPAALNSETLTQRCRAPGRQPDTCTTRRTRSSVAGGHGQHGCPGAPSTAPGTAACSTPRRDPRPARTSAASPGRFLVVPSANCSGLQTKDAGIISATRTRGCMTSLPSLQKSVTS